MWDVGGGRETPLHRSGLPGLAARGRDKRACVLLPLSPALSNPVRTRGRVSRRTE